MDFKLILCYYVIINLLSYLLYGYDKNQARKQGRRISERCLLGLAFFGGMVGAYLGMKHFHHKTKHNYFYAVIALSAVLHIALLVYLF